MTLEQLYLEGSEEYWPARTAKVKAIQEYVEGLIKPDLWPVALAQEIMEHAECNGRINGNTINGEIPASYSNTGNPIAFEI